MKNIWCCLVVLGLASACGSGSSSSGGSGSSNNSSSASEFLKSVISAQCALVDRCASTIGRQYSSQDACKSQYNGLEGLYQAAFGQGYFAYLDTLMSVDTGKTQACLDAYATLACDTSTKIAVCRDVFVVKHPYNVGDHCGSIGNDLPTQSCPLTASCVGSPTACETCMADLADGASCSGTNAECVNYCVNGTCAASRPVKEKGQPCTSLDTCRGNLECAGATGSKTCQERTGVNTACGTNDPGCYSDLTCVNGTCKATLAAGSACKGDHSTGECGSYLYCLGSSATATDGTCGFPNASVGAACQYYLYSTGGFPECGVNQWADTSTAGSCTCKATVENGQACSSHSACKSRNCSNMTGTPAMGTCAGPAAVGQACGFSEGCDSKYCDNTSKCAAPTCH